MPRSTVAAGRLSDSALTARGIGLSMEADGVERSWFSMYRWARHFNTGVYVVAMISAVSYQYIMSLVLAIILSFFLS